MEEVKKLKSETNSQRYKSKGRAEHQERQADKQIAAINEYNESVLRMELMRNVKSLTELVEKGVELVDAHTQMMAAFNDVNIAKTRLILPVMKQDKM